MNDKIKYMIPVFTAVFALMFVATAPNVIAEGVDYAKYSDDKYHKKGHGHKAILVEGFTGSVVIPKEMTKEIFGDLKEQITVTLGQAVSVAESNGVTDAIKAKVGITKDGEGNKYVVWKIISVDIDVESQIKTKNIFIVDAGDNTNFTSISKTIDHSKMKGDKIDRKIEKFQHKFSEPTGDSDVDNARSQFLDLLQQLRDAYENGDTEIVQSIKDQLQELKDDMFLNMRNSQF
ncbi:hypothetical protein [Nitrosopumilus sp.]|uniref:hypothetical protein n=1 Tax=Nitrosopumilus sp. TaxID=2024843 RepID=UPI003D0D1392